MEVVNDDVERRMDGNAKDSQIISQEMVNVDSIGHLDSNSNIATGDVTSIEDDQEVSFVNIVRKMTRLI